MIRTQIYLRDQQYHLAKLFAEENHTPVAEFIRQAVDMAIAEQERKRKKSRRKTLDHWIGSIKAVPLEPGMQVDDIYDDVLPWDRK